MQRSVVGGVDTGEGWECPQIILLDDREIVLVGAWTFGGGPSTVLVFPVGDTSRLETFDARTVYTDSVCDAETSHGPVVFGWLRETRQPAGGTRPAGPGRLAATTIVAGGDRASPSVRSELLRHWTGSESEPRSRATTPSSVHRRRSQSDTRPV